MPNVTTVPKTSDVKSRRLRRPWLIALLLCLLIAGLYLGIAPQWRERQLRNASVPHLRALADEQPHNARALYHLGQRLRAAGDTPGAFAALLRALRTSPEQADVWIAAAEVAEEEQGALAALQILERYLEAQPDSAPAHLALARLARRQRLWERAYVEARAVTQLTPDNALGWHLYGQAAAMTERPQEAEPALQKAFALDPRSWETQTSMGDLLVQKKRYAEALPYFREAIRLAPNQAVPYLSLGQTLLKANPDAKALEEARNALLRCQTLRPKIPVTYLYLGQCYSKQGRWAEAEQALEEARRRDPANMEIYFELGKVYTQLGNAPAARNAFDRHKRLVVFNDQRRVLLARIERAEQNGQVDTADRLRLELARKLAANEMHGEAIGHYQRLLARAPERVDLRGELAEAQRHRVNADALTLEGEDLLHGKRFTEAAQAFQAALDRDKNSARAWEGLGTALAATGDSKKALSAFLEAARRDPRRARAQMAVGEAYARIGLVDEARRRLQIAAKDDATRDNAQRALEALKAASTSTSLIRYSRLSLQLLREPNNAAARKERDAAEERLRAAGELPSKEILKPLLAEAAAR